MKRRWTGWVAVGAVSIVANQLWRAAGRKFANGPIGQLESRLRGQSSGSKS